MKPCGNTLTGHLLFNEIKVMNYREQMKDWLQKHPQATVEEAWEAGYMQSNSNWFHGKRELMENVIEEMKEIIG